MNRNGFKLFNDKDPFYSWHATIEDALKRREIERILFNNEYDMAYCTLEEHEQFVNAPELQYA
jgi:hypothetical protein